MPALIVLLGLLGGGVVVAWGNLKILRGGELLTARLSKVEEDNSGENTKYRLFFDYTNVRGFKKRFETFRDVDDLCLGLEFLFLVNRDRYVGILEPDLPGGLTFAQLFGTEPIPLKCWIRISVNPLLALVPLMGLIGPVSNAIEQGTVSIGYPFLYWATIIVQFIWFFSNHRYFSPGEPIKLDSEHTSHKDHCGEPYGRIR